MTSAPPSKTKTQLFWGLALVIVGISVFIKVWLVMPQLNQLSQSSPALSLMRIIGICIIGFILVGGGIRKIWQFIHPDPHV